MMLGVTPLAAQDYHYSVPNVGPREAQRVVPQHYQMQASVGQQGLVPLDAFSSWRGNATAYYSPGANANYAYQQQLVQPLGYAQQQTLPSYDRVTGSRCSSRSSSISISPVLNKNHIRLPPISALVSPQVYAQEYAQEQTQMEQLTAPSTAYHCAQLPSQQQQQQQQQPMVASPHPSFLQHSSCQHSHQHPHQSTAPSKLSRVRYNSVSSDHSYDLSNANHAKNEVLKSSLSDLSLAKTTNIDISNLDPSVRYRKQCPVCGKICSRPSTLKTHLLIHTGDTPFKCTWEGCTKSFNVKSNMLRHLKSHERKQAKKLGRKLPV